MKINGKEIAANILSNLKSRVEKHKVLGITPQLYIILLSDSPSSASYVKQKLLKGEEIGVKITLDKEDPNISTEKLIEKINKLNNDNKVNGIIVQRPMPAHLDETVIANLVTPQKDVDGFNENSIFEVPVAMAILKLLKNIHSDNFEDWLRLQKITVLGKGITAGKPIINSLNKLGIQPLTIDSKTLNKEEILKNSDIVISAVGKKNVFDVNDIKNGAIIIGVGQHKESDDKFHGDFLEEEIAEKNLYYSPTPGGVGPVNVACLLENLVEAFENSLK